MTPPDLEAIRADIADFAIRCEPYRPGEPSEHSDLIGLRLPAVVMRLARHAQLLLAEVERLRGGCWIEFPVGTTRIDTLSVGSAVEIRGQTLPAWEANDWPVVPESARDEFHREPHRHSSDSGIFMGCFTATFSRHSPIVGDIKGGTDR